MYLYLIDDAADNIPFSKLLAKSSTTDDKAAADDSDNSSNDDDEKYPKSPPVKPKRTSKKNLPRGRRNCRGVVNPNHFRQQVI